MRVYLSGRYRRRLELLACAHDLELLSHEVTAQWLRGETEHLLEHRLVHDPQWEQAALRDYQDVVRADCCIAFSERESDSGGGGRHVEFGIALALGRRVIVVGRIENLFQRLPQVEHYDSWAQALEALDMGATDHVLTHQRELGAE